MQKQTQKGLYRLGILLISIAFSTQVATAGVVGTWTKLSPTGIPIAGDPGQLGGFPTGRVWQPAAFDTFRNKVVVFGGSIAGGCDAGYINDLWTFSYSGNVWTQVLGVKRASQGADNTNYPMGRDNHQITYDSFQDLYWMYGGTCSSGTNAGITTNFQSVWSFNPKTLAWNRYDVPTALDSPSVWARYDHVWQYVPDQRVIVFHAGASGSAKNDTWTFDVVSHAWAQGNPNGSSSAPPVRDQIQNAWAYDSANKRVVIFGGEQTPTSLRNDTWTYDVASNAWIQKSPSNPPSSRRQHAMAYDAANGVVVLYGGSSPSDAFLNDTWVYDVAANTWTQLAASGQPPTLAHHNLQYDPINRRLIMWGGAVASGGSKNTETWVLTLTGGSTPTPPPADTTSPSTPTNLSATVSSSSQINLAWTASTDNTAVTGYRVYRNAALVSTVGQNSYQDTGLSPSTSYSYQVEAFDAANNTSAKSTNASATTLASSSPPPPTSSSSMPSLANERSTYTSWGWTWTLDKEPNYSTAGSYNVITTNPDIHNESEGDDLWTNLMQYRRTGQNGYLDRALAWADYFKTVYPDCVNNPNSGYCYDGSFLLDHLYGYGLVELNLYNGDSAALTAVQTLAGLVESYWNVPGHLADPMSFYGTRQGARHLLLATRVAEVTQNQRWITLRDKLINLWLQSPDWDAGNGMYFVSQYTTDGKFHSGDYAKGYRVFSTFQIGILSEAFYKAYLATGNTALRDRMVAMARFVDKYALETSTQYADGWVIFDTNTKSSYVYGPYPYNGATPIPDPSYTTSLVNTLVRGYKYTGDRTLYDRAKYFFNRGTKGAYGTGARLAADNVVHHFVDTRFDSSTANFYYAYNKGELLYTYLVFENGGNPTVEGSTAPPPSTPPAPPTGLTVN